MSTASGASFWRAKYARECIKRFQQDQPPAPILRGPSQDLPSDRPPLYKIPSPNYKIPLLGGPFKESQNLHVGIIGAGAAGLYTAMILQDLGIEYEILEGSKRPGGRILTHRFESSKEWSYFDVGAMRYPDIPIMWRVFDLFRKRLGIEDKLIPYIMSCDNQILEYNTRRVTQKVVSSDPTADHFGDSKSQGGLVPLDFVQKGDGYWLDQCFGPFKQIFVTQGWERGFARLMDFDGYSARMFMATKFNIQDGELQLNKEAYPQSVINWLERMNTGTGLFDMAFSEMVLDDLEFDYPLGAYGLEAQLEQEDVKWHCLSGGSQIFIDKMVSQIPAQKVQYKKRVMKIEPVEPTDLKKPLSVTTFEDEPRYYDYVISTIPLSALRYVNLDHCNLSYAQWEGLRTLRYDSSCKVGMRFTTRWWQTLESGSIKGGQSKTDRVIRTAVFPSYGIHDTEADAVMIASYTWSQDALRVGGLVHSDESVLINHILGDLAEMHGVTFDFLKKQLREWYSFDWYADPFTLGAFALFGPSQFSSIYPSFGQGGAGGRLLFAGEAVSEQHAWVEGALDSAYEAVHKMLEVAQLPTLLEKLKVNWGKPSIYLAEDEEQNFKDLMAQQAKYGAILSDPTDE